MNRRQALLLHLLSWVVLLVTPLSLLNLGSGTSMEQYANIVMATMVMMGLFYANYCWLTPRYFMQGNRKKRFHIACNLAICVVGGVAIHGWMSRATTLGGYFQPPTTLQHLLLILRDVFSLMVTAAIATTLRLSEHWQRSEEARLEAERAKAEAELKHLRNQISPHFLLNTLNNIYALTTFDTDKAQQAILQLSNLLRHLLYDDQQLMVALDQEVEFMRNYVNLMKIRLPQNVNVGFRVEGDTRHTKVAPLLFIPLIENAFKHGVSPMEHSFIDVDITCSSDTLVFHIVNSNHPKDSNDNSGHGIGLRQVQRRLQLAYPQQHTWQKGTSSDGATYSSLITINLT